MTTFFEILGMVGGYLVIGMTVARLQSKRIYRQMQKYYQNRTGNAHDNYIGSLAGWVFFWPLRTLSVILRFVGYHLILHPVEATFSACADYVKAPVADTLNEIKEVQEQAEEWANQLSNKKLDDAERDIMRKALDDIYSRGDSLREELGIVAPLRRAISAPRNETVDRGMDTARQVLKDRGYSYTSGNF